ncbi:MAG TPA: low temperature requirement protein A [Dehalococcoidia bacterium]|nr:low temperature requirement protein A [Dehalococcoidia bacterium]
MREAAKPAHRRWGPPFTGPGEQSATFVELFFDFVFVFALTEVTALTLHHLDWEGAARSLLIFWMIWWAWGQWTWALNPADTEHGLVKVMTLVTTAIAFIMAASVGEAFGDGGGLWFAIPYVGVRASGLAIAMIVASENDERLQGVMRFALASIPGLVIVIIGGLVDPDVRAWIWLAVAVTDIAASMIATSGGGWTLNAAHFVERHALFVIIALDESLIVVGVIVTNAERTTEIVSVAIGAVTVICLLWWSYFGWLNGAFESQLEREPHETEVQLARDAGTLLHFPVIGGIIGIAVGFEEMVLHPDRPLETAGMVALAAGLVLFIGGGAAVWARVGKQLLLPRLGLLAALALFFAADAQAARRARDRRGGGRRDRHRRADTASGEAPDRGGLKLARPSTPSRRRACCATHRGRQRWPRGRPARPGGRPAPRRIARVPRAAP